MDIYARLTRRLLVGISILAIVTMAFGVFNPHSDTSLYVRLIPLVPIAVLAAGLILGSYIHKFIDSLVNRPERGSFTLIAIIAIGGPLFIGVAASLGAYDRIYMLQLIQELDLSFIDSREVRYNFVHFSVLGIAALVLFVWNAFDLLRARSSAQAT